MKKNLFIAFEGIDGCGKSTQVKLLTKHLQDSGHRVYETFEPTDSEIGLMIRKIFRHDIEADHRTIAALFIADRIHHVTNKQNGIIKKLNEGYTVICDRYCLSSYAYQGIHVPIDWVIKANSISTDLLRPDLNIYIDITPEQSMQRLHQGRENLEMYETIENLTQVRNMYELVIEKLKNTENIFITDGNRSEAEVFDSIKSAIDNLTNH